MGVQVDQAGQRDQSVGVDDLGTLRAQAGADLGDGAVLEQQVGRRRAEDADAP